MISATDHRDGQLPPSLAQKFVARTSATVMSDSLVGEVVTLVGDLLTRPIAARLTGPVAPDSVATSGEAEAGSAGKQPAEE